MDTLCGNCAFFIAHYGKRGKYYFLLHCGHCVQKYSKHRKPDMSACQWYEPAKALQPPQP